MHMVARDIGRLRVNHFVIKYLIVNNELPYLSMSFSIGVVAIVDVSIREASYSLPVPLPSFVSFSFVRLEGGREGGWLGYTS